MRKSISDASLEDAADNAPGEVCDDVVDGNPVKKCCGSNNCFDKISSIVYKEGDKDEQLRAIQDDKDLGDEPEGS